MAHDGVADMSGFKLGTPALVCRWRLANRHLPLENRHLRALLARQVNGAPITTELVAWAKQHLEWNLEQGALAHPNGTLMLIVDTEGQAAMTVGPYEPLPDTSAQALAARADSAQTEAASTGVAPETLWAARGESLLWDPAQSVAPSGAASLVLQLAQTLGIPVKQHDDLADAVLLGAPGIDEAFLVSDEHGVAPASDATGPMGARMAQAYQRLLERR